MIYIKDYRALNALITDLQPSFWKKIFNSLIGRNITVFLDNTSTGIHGLLFKVTQDYIVLKTEVPKALNKDNCFNHYNDLPRKLLTHTFIVLDHITAISYRE